MALLCECVWLTSSTNSSAVYSIKRVVIVVRLLPFKWHPLHNVNAAAQHMNERANVIGI